MIYWPRAAGIYQRFANCAAHSTCNYFTIGLSWTEPDYVYGDIFVFHFYYRDPKQGKDEYLEYYVPADMIRNPKVNGKPVGDSVIGYWMRHGINNILSSRGIDHQKRLLEHYDRR